MKKMRQGDFVFELAEMTDGMIACGKSIEIWENGKAIRSFPDLIHRPNDEEFFESILKILADGNLLIASKRLSDIRIFDAKTGALLREFTGHEGAVQCVTVLSDGTVVNGSRDKEILIWNPLNVSLIKRIQTKI